MSDQPSGQPTPPSNPVAGWYADPADPSLQRYWDGAAWTTHTAPVAGPSSWPATMPSAPLYGAAGYGSTAYPGWGVTPRSVGFGDAIKRAFRGWTDYSSRATVAEYWWFYLFSLLLTLVPYVVLLVLSLALLPTSTSSSSSTAPLTPRSEPSGAAIAALIVVGILFFVLAIGLFLVQLPLTIRRLHDTDREGWWYFISFVPFGSFVLLYFMILPGTPGPNRYGPVPT